MQKFVEIFYKDEDVFDGKVTETSLVFPISDVAAEYALEAINALLKFNKNGKEVTGEVVGFKVIK